MLRILKPQGRAYPNASKYPWSYVDAVEREKMLGRFKVEKREGSGEFWAVVSPRSR